MNFIAEAYEACADGVKACIVRRNFSRAVGHGPFAEAQARVGHRTRHLDEDTFPRLCARLCRRQHFSGWQRIALTEDNHSWRAHLGLVKVLRHGAGSLDLVSDLHRHVGREEPQAAVCALPILNAHIASKDSRNDT